LDGHDRGVKVISAAFRDAGFEVIYTSLRQTAEMIVEAVIQLEKMGVGKLFAPGATTIEAIEYVKKAISERRKEERFFERNSQQLKQIKLSTD
jgi:methylmalonyl-CoA mutase C-terminal domain/subunit